MASAISVTGPVQFQIGPTAPPSPSEAAAPTVIQIHLTPNTIVATPPAAEPSDESRFWKVLFVATVMASIAVAALAFHAPTSNGAIWKSPFDSCLENCRLLAETTAHLAARQAERAALDVSQVMSQCIQGCSQILPQISFPPLPTLGMPKS